MPELPEVETMRRGIRGIVGARISDITVVKSRALKPILISPLARTFRKRTVGREVSSVERLGKRVVIVLDNDDSIIFEPRMTGLLLIADPPNEVHLRFAMHLAECPHAAVWYWDRRGLGRVQLMTPKQRRETYGPDRLGPDALALSVADWRQRLGGSKREIKVALLDQRAIAGIGNLYASEILHRAGIDPRKRCHTMSRPMWESMQSATKEVLNQAIAYEGSTLGDGTYRNALNRRGAYQNHHRVYMKAGQVCPSCSSATIQRIVQTQRSTFYCPGCQKKSRVKGSGVNCRNGPAGASHN